MKTVLSALFLLLPSWALAQTVVVDGLTGEPLLNAQVELVGTQFTTTTDADGRFTLRQVSGFDYLRITAPGYGVRQTRRGVEARLWPLQVSDEQVETYLEWRDRPEMDSDNLDDPDLRPSARNFIAAKREHPLVSMEPDPDILVVRSLVPPATIRLYRRGPENNSCRGRVEVIALEEYTRGVVPHEWIPSWAPESLKAGAVAARGYAWGWINRGGKYDCADLDDSTRSQVYRDDRDPRGDAAVAATTGQGIQRNGDFIPSEYSAENGDPTEFGVDEPLCSGRRRQGHGRGMCQWGTHRWASQRNKTYQWMVSHYFPGATVSGGGDVDPPVDPPPAGQAVLELRQRLNRVEPEPCADPANTYNCADFVNQGWSEDLFDLYMGRSLHLTYEVTNTGGRPSPQNTEINVTLPPGLFELTSINAPGDDRNQTVGDNLRIFLPGIAPGGQAAVIMTIRAVGYSAPSGAPAHIRGWVRQIGDLYDKPRWDQAAQTNVNQIYNGGDLRVQTELDVFDPHRWTWQGGDPAMLEGWSAVSDVQSLTAPDGLRIQPSGARPTIESPWAPIDADRNGHINVATTPARGGRVFWRRAGQGFSADRSAPMQNGVAAAAELPGWSGQIQQIRVELEGQGAVTVDSVAIVPGGPRPPGPDPDMGIDPPPPVDWEIPPPVRDAQASSGDMWMLPPARDAWVPTIDPDDGILRLDARPPPPDMALVDGLTPGSGQRVTHVKQTGGCNSTNGPAPWLLAVLLGLAIRRRRTQ